MTDAERIALYLGEKPEHIAEILAAPSRFAWDRAQISATQLASMLAAVRRGEREKWESMRPIKAALDNVRSVVRDPASTATEWLAVGATWVGPIAAYMLAEEVEPG